ncbi:MAG: 4-(cytidine 5'-diphospho)-2-C-methyl-D-erythritol kinase [Candidatus Aminicenantes bacterium]|nr:4-(cytidine 5'-diphospho)-2-C-methyl-D-erythritol kinase [Candidatus Aminicenantes bacterium]
MNLPSYAKINIGLEVLRKRKDGFHEILTLFQTIDFFDVLNFRLYPKDAVCLEGDDGCIAWDETNLIYKAAHLLKKKCRVSAGIEIHVEKKVPHGKGLGGGSSNAAVTLYALNRLWEIGLSKGELMTLGGQLGSDVPYFLEGGLCLGLARGDRIRPLEDLPRKYCLLAFPEMAIMTAAVYGRFRPSLTSKRKASKIIKFLEVRDFHALENDLEETVFELYPQIKAIKSQLRNSGSDLSLVSGSGSAVFGLFADHDKASKAFEGLTKELPSLLVETVSRKQYWKSLRAGV